ncbi:MAG: TRAM domain-containing protein, partial [Opitutales bacterium]
SLERNLAMVGTLQEVLIEGPARKGEGMFMGRNPGNRKVIVAANPRLVGEVVPVRITGATVSILEGELSLTGVDEPTGGSLLQGH